MTFTSEKTFAQVLSPQACSPCKCQANVSCRDFFLSVLWAVVESKNVPLHFPEFPIRFNFAVGEDGNVVCKGFSGIKAYFNQA